MKNYLACLFVICFVVGCAADKSEFANDQATSTDNPTDNSVPALNLYGFSVESATLTIKVISNGCTSEKDFALQFQFAKEATKILVTREKPDLCKAMPRLVEVKLKDPKLICRGKCSFEPVNTVKKPEEFRGPRG